jgi:hypothetical protein
VVRQMRVELNGVCPVCPCSGRRYLDNARLFCQNEPVVRLCILDPCCAC